MPNSRQWAFCCWIPASAGMQWLPSPLESDSFVMPAKAGIQFGSQSSELGRSPRRVPSCLSLVFRMGASFVLDPSLKLEFFLDSDLRSVIAKHRQTLDQFEKVLTARGFR